MHTNDQTKARLDILAISASLLCLIHCLAGPIILLVVPGLFEPKNTLLVHFLLGTVVIGLAFYALWRGYQHHSNSAPMFIGFAGALLLIFALFFNQTTHDHSEIDLHILLTVFGSCLLIAAHVQNLRACPSCRLIKIR